MRNLLFVFIIAAGALTLAHRLFPEQRLPGQRVEFVQQASAPASTAPTKSAPAMQLVGFYGDEENVIGRKSQEQTRSPAHAEPQVQEKSQTHLTSVSAIENARRNQLSNVAVEASGGVERILADDNEGDRHQRFIVRINSDMTVLVAHNIDVAQRISDLTVGDEIYFHGEYVWNPKGGLVHWTHHDPQGRHFAGWLKYHGTIYQ